MKRAAVHNLGCKVNSYESDSMCRMLEEAGYEIVDYTEIADVYVINTCTVTNMADRKSRQMLHKVRKENPQAIVVAAGCYVQVQEAEKLKNDGVDIILGNNLKHDLINQINEFSVKHNNVKSKEDSTQNQNISDEEFSYHVMDLTKEQTYESLGILEKGEHTRAFLKVQDGCNQFCSYCIIPFARGRVRSRALDEIIEEVKKLAGNGYKEVVLTGIHLSSYGIGQGETLLSLIQAVNQVDGIERIRLGSLEPGIITNEFVEEVSKLDKFCPHFHLSLQSGCDTVLERMNRKYSAKEYKNKCKLIRKYFDHPAFTTDVIVGFPGETKEEFEDTCDFVESIGFYEIHVFKYSPRSGTKAAQMSNQVPEQIKSERSKKLMKIVQDMKAAFEIECIGQHTHVLFEENVTIDDKNYLVGHTKEYVKVHYLQNEVVNSEEQVDNEVMSGQLVEGDITLRRNNGTLNFVPTKER